MNNEFGIVIRDRKAVVSSRDVARVFEKPHNDLLKAIRNLECSEEFRLGNFSQSSYINDQNREMPEIIMSRDGFSFLAMGFTGVRAARWKELYIAAFNAMEKNIVTSSHISSFNIPRSLPEALRLAADLAEKVQQDAPKVLFAEAVSTSKTEILIGDLAKILHQNGIDIGQKRLFEFLRNDGYLMKYGSSRNMPTQRSMELGIFRVKETTITKPDGSVLISHTVKVTGKGQVYFVNLFLKKKLALVA